jgi:hypothetical protein
MKRARNDLWFPKNGEIAHALLALLYSEGGKECALRSAQTYEPLAEHFNLSKKARSITRAECLGDNHHGPYWNNLVQGTRGHLVRQGHVERYAGHGIWMLTPKGRVRACASNP